MLEEFFMNILKLNKKDKIKLRKLMFEKIWQDKEFYNFLLQHQKYLTFYQSQRVSEKLKEIGEITDEKIHVR